jgi:hypothetical protein
VRCVFYLLHNCTTLVRRVFTCCRHARDVLFQQSLCLLLKQVAERTFRCFSYILQL